MRDLVVMAAAGLLLVIGAEAKGAQEKTAPAAERQVTLTLYQDDLALVADRRRVTLAAGENRVAFPEVSARILPESASLRSVKPPQGVVVREQIFDFDLLTPESLLRRSVGRSVRLVRTHPTTGEETEVEAQVLSVTEGVVLRVGERIETGVPGRIVFPDVPEGLRHRPTLVLDLNADAARPFDLELRYLSAGLSWRADYVAELSAGGDAFDLSARVTLVNQSGARYPGARVRLVAGDVHRAEAEAQKGFDVGRRELMAAAAPALREEGIFEYHLYRLEHPTTLEENQTKQVLLLTAEGVPLRREFVLDGQEYYYRGRHGELGRNLPVAAIAEFDNRADQGLGIPLPRGVVRVYQPSGGAEVAFVGEDRIGHTPEGETVRLRLGNAFDLVADRTQTDFRRIPTEERQGQIFEAAFRIALRNAKEEGVTVTVKEPLPGDWEIVHESHPHEKTSAREALWRIDVPAKGGAVLEYRARVRF